MTENKHIEPFLTHWQSINRYLRKGMLTEGPERITRLQWTLLRYVNRKDACSVGKLAEHFGVRPSTVSQMMDRLEKAGLVQRVSDSRDARIKLVHLTEKGKAFILSIESVWAKRLSDSLDQLSDDEQQTLIELLERLDLSMQKSANSSSFQELGD
ncbi:MarR family winged helix-turn-helix transcriptional regulator [Alicyclobacillus dauci]|uniref:MarR family transcriptional regulator n=1 Tax=Alicyclobacillus dauci TaxID=1475485 RepID=A0ABY6Z3C5_9BACL|nr:MarR family transcriptional regulator [Alicyclobacillus dauci]WAH37123.1 MarR family transcriptional regulator [Alicyclobacillus dauci]